MNYMGGKHRHGPEIARIVRHVFEPGMRYFEPFCGALGSATRVIPLISDDASRVVLSDVSLALISMWKAVMSGWVPPHEVTNEDWTRIKNRREPEDPLTAFYGFGCSLRGIYFAGGGIAESTEWLSKRAGTAVRSILRKRSIIAQNAPDATFGCSSYDKILPKGNAVIYCDPPYADRSGSEKFATDMRFDSAAHWQYVRDRVAAGCVVLVTEYVGPDDFFRVCSWGDTANWKNHFSGGETDGTCESIFMHESQAHLVTELLPKHVRRRLEKRLASAAPAGTEAAPDARRPRTPSAFERAWEKKKAEGYQYGEDALEQVRLGWEMAVASMGQDDSE